MSIRMSMSWAFVALALACLLTLSGCMRVARHEVPYYLKSPHQVEPPDGFLPMGSKVLVFGEKDSYARVLTFRGVAAHVWNRALATPAEWREEQQTIRASEQ